MEEIQQIVQEDIELYFSLHPEITPDLFEHCKVMEKQLLRDYVSII